MTDHITPDKARASLPLIGHRSLSVARDALKIVAAYISQSELRIAELERENGEYRRAQAEVFLALGGVETQRDKWPAIITELRRQRDDALERTQRNAAAITEAAPTGESHER